MFSTASILRTLFSGEGDGDGEELLSLESSASDGNPNAARTRGCRSATVCTQKITEGTQYIFRPCLISSAEQDIGLKETVVTFQVDISRKISGDSRLFLDLYTVANLWTKL